MSVLLLTASLLFQAAPATTETPAPATAEQPKEERKICRRVALATSLHGSKRVCLTAAEWRERQGSDDRASSVGTRSGGN